MSVVDVLCYRDYTREGKRVISHSLLLEDIMLPDKMAADGILITIMIQNVHVFICYNIS